MALPVALFPPRPTLAFTTSGPLQDALDTAIDDLKTRMHKTVPFPIAIIDLEGGDTLECGSYLPDEVDYIASSAKVAAMLAAFGLRDMARRLFVYLKMATGVAGMMAASGGPKAVNRAVAGIPSLFQAMRTYMDPEVEDNSPALLHSVRHEHRVPQYDQVFAPSPKDAWSYPDFSGSFRASMKAMIVPSDNNGAGRVVRGVGYGYLNGLLEHFGLLDPDTPTGIWLAGDYIGIYPYVRIQSNNDGGVAQAGTALAQAQMMAMIVNKACIDPASCDEMRTLLAQAAKGVDQPFVSREDVKHDLRIPLSKITHAKLGYGPLKRGTNVASEIFRIEGIEKAGKAYAVAYQNVVDAEPTNHVARVIRHTLKEYE
jgi:hypothetical protein